MKTRSSSGVGQNVDLEFDIDHLRIKDLDEDSEQSDFKKRGGAIFDNIKRNSVVSQNTNESTVKNNTGMIKADVNSSKLKQMLASIKSST
jgi:hypothetical protein